MRVVFAGDDHTVDGVSAPHFPILIDQKTGVFEPAFPFLREQVVFLRRAPGSLEIAARILCIWLNRLNALGRAWDEPCPDDFVSWALTESGHLSPARQRLRAHVVYAFYEHLVRQPTSSWQVQSFVDELSDPVAAHVLAGGKKVQRRLRLRFGKGRQAMRPTPSEEEVESIAAALLGSGQTFAQVRNWLIVQTALATNLRLQGLSQLAIEHIDSMLREEGLIGPGESVGFMASSSGPRTRLRQGIDQFEISGRRFFLSPAIFEKGKLRNVRFPIALVRQLLEFIWTERREVCRDAGWRSSHLWVSLKTGEPLKRGSIGDILKSGFEMAGARGSGHRIRATHCIGLFREYLAKADQNGGTHKDLEAILERVAQIMGHNKPETLRPYLNLVLLEKLVGELD